MLKLLHSRRVRTNVNSSRSRVASFPSEVTFERRQRFENGDFQKSLFTLRADLRVKSSGQRKWRPPTPDEKAVIRDAVLARAFAAFMGALRQELGLGPARGVVAVDAKSLRRGYEKGRAHMPPLMVSVWDTQTRLAIAQGRAPGNGEVKATLALLKGLVLKGCTVTADALHGHAEMARAVRAAKAHYCLGLKGNRGPLFAAVAASFASAGEDAPFHETTEAGHGRQERRRASVLPAKALAAGARLPGPRRRGRIDASRVLPDGRTTGATRYLLLSRAVSPRKLLDTVRAHWSIENHLHWTLDVVFDEDDARARKNYAPENLAVIRRLALNILNAHPDKRSPASKMRQAKRKQQYFLSLFAHLQ